MPSRRTSFPSFGGTTGLTFCSSLQHFPVRWVLCGPGCFTYGHPSASYLLGGAVRASQVPGESSRTFALLIGPRPCHPTTVISVRWYRPRHSEHEGHDNKTSFEADSHGFSTRCLRFQFRFPYTGKTRSRSGDSPYRMGFEPIRLLQQISSVALSPPIPTLQAFLAQQCSGFRFQQTINPDTRNLTPLSLMIQRR